MLQGRQRFGALALVMGLETLLRVGGAITGLVLGRSPAAALGGLATGMLIATAVAYVLCGRPRPSRPSGVLLRRVGARRLRDGRAGGPRQPRRDPGPHGAAAATSPGCTPSAPSSRRWPTGCRRRSASSCCPGWPTAPAGGRRWRRGVLAVLGLDALVVLGGALFGAELLPLIGGAGYRGESAPLWLFALTGMLLAVGQLLLFSRLAAGDVRSIVAVWVGVLAEVGLVRWWLRRVRRHRRRRRRVRRRASSSWPGSSSRSGAPGTVDGRRGDTGTDGGQHGGLGECAVGPALSVAGQPTGDRDGGGDTGPAEHDPHERPRIHLPHQRSGDE